ncbi:MAG: exodeoxyribonuclease VII large subunit [Endomicrobiia bacterium]|nr:exodeoxyribonuclease VII large subunit [Endomicrobiia bacterium]
MNIKIYTVTELNSEIKRLIEPRLSDVWVEGEISNYKVYSSGHAYFTLKDEGSQIQCVMFADSTAQLRFVPEDGLVATSRGRVSLYVKSGRHQVVVYSMEPKGKGALQIAFEQLKKKLKTEGLFDDARKRPLPMLPSSIGVVTSPTGAAIRDILAVINRRFANVRVLIYPVAVQGDNAKGEISAAIKYLNNNHPDLDVLLVGRGGGSYEDLWAFNEEAVARAIFESKIPVISCVGHEIDFTIADFVADVRAPTPSAAAELVVRNKSDMTERIKRLASGMVSSMRRIAAERSASLGRLAASGFFKNPSEYINKRAQDLDYLAEHLAVSSANFEREKRHRLDNLAGRLHLLSPLAILSRGYAVVWKTSTPDGKPLEDILLKDSKDVKSKDRVKIRLGKGEFEAEVADVPRAKGC